MGHPSLETANYYNASDSSSDAGWRVIAIQELGDWALTSSLSERGWHTSVKFAWLLRDSGHNIDCTSLACIFTYAVQRHRFSVGANPTRQRVVPAGSSRSDDGGDNVVEVLRWNGSLLVT